jgi:hypothetical protein
MGVLQLELTTKDPGTGSMTFEVRVRVGSALGVKGTELEGYAYFTNWVSPSLQSDATHAHTCTCAALALLSP